MSSVSSNSLVYYSAATPNGRSPSILLEELKAAYGLQHEFRKLTLSKGEHRQAWFTQLNPNAKIPVLIDGLRKDFVVAESSAILMYLAQHYDRDCKFSFDPIGQSDDYSEMIQWLFFTHGEIGPILMQSGHFKSLDMPYPKNRFLEEVKRLLGVVETRLASREYLAGSGKGSYSLADMKIVTWLNGHVWGGIESLDQWPNVKAYTQRLNARPGVQAATASYI